MSFPTRDCLVKSLQFLIGCTLFSYRSQTATSVDGKRIYTNQRNWNWPLHSNEYKWYFVFNGKLTSIYSNVVQVRHQCSSVHCSNVRNNKTLFVTRFSRYRLWMNFICLKDLICLTQIEWETMFSLLFALCLFVFCLRLETFANKDSKGICLLLFLFLFIYFCISK